MRMTDGLVASRGMNASLKVHHHENVAETRSDSLISLSTGVCGVNNESRSRLLLNQSPEHTSSLVANHHYANYGSHHATAHHLHQQQMVTRDHVSDAARISSHRDVLSQQQRAPDPNPKPISDFPMTITSSSSSSGNKNNNWLYTKEQVACVCETLQQANDTDRLERFLWSLPAKEPFRNDESVLKGQAMVAFHREKYDELYAILQSHNFDPKHHDHLQKIWYQAHYR